MDSVLEFLLTLFQISGLYFGPAKSAARLLRWPHCYTFAMTMAMIMYVFMIVFLCFYEGNAVIARRGGSDVLKTMLIIEDMKPITRTATMVHILLYYHFFLQVYSRNITKGQRLFQLISGPSYNGLENCWTLWAGLVGIMLGYSAICMLGFESISVGMVWYFFIIFYSIINVHYYHNLTMHLYALIQNIRCLRREYLLIQSHHNLETMITRLPTIAKIISNVHHTNLIISTTLGAQLLHMIIQMAFDLFYVVFQRKKPLFVKNAFALLGYEVFSVVILFLLAEMLMHVFGQLTRSLNAKLATKLVQSHRLTNKRGLQHWRIQWFMLAEQRHHLQLQILPNVAIRFAQLISIAFFTWDLSILLYQTEFM